MPDSVHMLGSATSRHLTPQASQTTGVRTVSAGHTAQPGLLPRHLWGSAASTSQCANSAKNLSQSDVASTSQASNLEDVNQSGEQTRTLPTQTQAIGEVESLGARIAVQTKPPNITQWSANHDNRHGIPDEQFWGNYGAPFSWPNNAESYSCVIVGPLAIRPAQYRHLLRQHWTECCGGTYSNRPGSSILGDGHVLRFYVTRQLFHALRTLAREGKGTQCDHLQTSLLGSRPLTRALSLGTVSRAP